MTTNAPVKLPLAAEIGGKSVQINVTLPVSFERVTDCLTGAIEGGSGYWCKTFLPTPASDHLKVAIRERGGVWYDDVEFWERDGCARVEFDPPIEKDDGFRFVGRTQLERGLNKMAEIAPDHFADLINENDDASTHDVFLQCVLFGEIVFG